MSIILLPNTIPSQHSLCTLSTSSSTCHWIFWSSLLLRNCPLDNQIHNHSHDQHDIHTRKALNEFIRRHPLPKRLNQPIRPHQMILQNGHVLINAIQLIPLPLQLLQCHHTCRLGLRHHVQRIVQRHLCLILYILRAGEERIAGFFGIGLIIVTVAIDTPIGGIRTEEEAIPRFVRLEALYVLGQSREGLFVICQFLVVLAPFVRVGHDADLGLEGTAVSFGIADFFLCLGDGGVSFEVVCFVGYGRYKGSDLLDFADDCVPPVLYVRHFSKFVIGNIEKELI
mmetsp:Transcript_23213/g.29280  ORF Transcript_23213/g.29280 Transcript_23213/m.29280 type:complete len:283 (+) Transcript_23213:247-1095(+)